MAADPERERQRQKRRDAKKQATQDNHPPTILYNDPRDSDFFREKGFIPKFTLKPPNSDMYALDEKDYQKITKGRGRVVGGALDEKEREEKKDELEERTRMLNLIRHILDAFVQTNIITQERYDDFDEKGPFFSLEKLTRILDAQYSKLISLISDYADLLMRKGVISPNEVHRFHQEYRQMDLIPLLELFFEYYNEINELPLETEEDVGETPTTDDPSPDAAEKNHVTSMHGKGLWDDFTGAIKSFVAPLGVMGNLPSILKSADDYEKRNGRGMPERFSAQLGYRPHPRYE